MNILITAATTAQAYKLKRFLDSGQNFFYADQQELPSFTASSVAFVKIPPAQSASFAHAMLALCLDYSIQVVYPLRRKEILALAESRQLFDEYDIRIMVPLREIAEELLKMQAQPGDLQIIDREPSSSDNGNEKMPLVNRIDRGVLLVNSANPTHYSIFTTD